jgi:hypothetical protein
MYFNHIGGGSDGPARAQVSIPGGGVVKMVPPKPYAKSAQTILRTETPMHARQRHLVWSEEEYGVRALPRIVSARTGLERIARTKPLKLPRASGVPAVGAKTLSARYPHPGFSCLPPLPPLFSNPVHMDVVAEHNLPKNNSPPRPEVSPVDGQATAVLSALDGSEQQPATAAQVVADWLAGLSSVPAEVSVAVQQLAEMERRTLQV